MTRDISHTRFMETVLSVMNDMDMFNSFNPRKGGVPKRLAARLVCNVFIESMMRFLRTGDPVTIKKFGRFKPKMLKPFRKRLKDGSMRDIHERMTVKFEASESLLKELEVALNVGEEFQNINRFLYL